MKQQLWILNSSLLLMFFLVIVISAILKEEPPLIIKKKIVTPEEIEKKKITPKIDLETIYKQDIFGTYIPTEKPIEKKSWITPIPEPKFITIPIPEENLKPQLLPPLTIKIKGIISTATEKQSVVMIADETNKEKMYHLSDKIKDGIILKISRNEVVILRTNGQQETYILRKPNEFLKTEKDKLAIIIKKIADDNYQIDPYEFTKEVDSLGSFIENLSLLTAFQKGKNIGIRIGKIKSNEIFNNLGLNTDDIITKINGIETITTKNRIKIYDKITNASIGDIIKVQLSRKNQPITIQYKLVKLEKPLPKPFDPNSQNIEQLPDNKKVEFKTNIEQEREKRIREFEKAHKEPSNQDIIAQIRERILNNLRNNAMNRRTQ